MLAWGRGCCCLLKFSVGVAAVVLAAAFLLGDMEVEYQEVSSVFSISCYVFCGACASSNGIGGEYLGDGF